MTVKNFYVLICTIALTSFACFSTLWAQTDPGTKIDTQAQSTTRWTGIAAAPGPRIFVNFPRWSKDIKTSVATLNPDGSTTPYPDEKTNSWQPGQAPSNVFVCVQALWIDKEGFLWVLDPANPEFAGTVENGPKLVKINLQTNKIEKIYPFSPEVAPKDSYLNDMRIDLFRKRAYITDSGTGALVVLDLENSKSKRLLSNHPSTKAQDITLDINGTKWTRPVHADGIALDPAEEYVYYQALSSRTLYRVPAGTLAHPNATDESVGSKVQEVAQSGASDGLMFDQEANLYISALEHNAVKMLTPQGEIKTIVQSPDIVWPDSFASLPDGTVYFTTSRINEGTPPKQPCAVFKLTKE